MDDILFEPVLIGIDPRKLRTFHIKFEASEKVLKVNMNAIKICSEFLFNIESEENEIILNSITP